MGCLLLSFAFHPPSPCHQTAMGDARFQMRERVTHHGLFVMASCVALVVGDVPGAVPFLAVSRIEPGSPIEAAPASVLLVEPVRSARETWQVPRPDSADGHLLAAWYPRLAAFDHESGFRYLVRDLPVGCFLQALEPETVPVWRVAAPLGQGCRAQVLESDSPPLGPPRERAFGRVECRRHRSSPMELEGAHVSWVTARLHPRRFASRLMAWAVSVFDQSCVPDCAHEGSVPAWLLDYEG
jgi:hypothetical protein